MKCLFVYNPQSGKSKILKYVEYIKNHLSKIYDVVDVYESTSPQDLKDTVQQRCSLYDTLIFSGGDGTFNDVACGISSCEKIPTLGYIPTGTTNDIARNLKIPRNVKKAVKVIMEQTTIKHDIGKVNDNYFMYVLALGACSGTSYTTKQEVKKILGRLAYAHDGINDFFFNPNINKIRIISGDETIETSCPLVLILNTVHIGGMPFNRYGYLNDGLFDVVLIKNGRGYGRFNIIKFFLRGIMGLKRKKHAVTLRSGDMRVEVSDDAIWCADGEKGPQGTIHIQNLHNHLTIFVPKRKAKSQKINNGE